MDFKNNTFPDPDHSSNVVLSIKKLLFSSGKNKYNRLFRKSIWMYLKYIKYLFLKDLIKQTNINIMVYFDIFVHLKNV